VRLPSVDTSTTPFNRPTAEVLASHIADRVDDDVNITDILVMGTVEGRIIRMEYELKGEVHHRVLRTTHEIESFPEGSKPLHGKFDSRH